MVGVGVAVLVAVACPFADNVALAVGVAVDVAVAVLVAVDVPFCVAVAVAVFVEVATPFGLVVIVAVAVGVPVGGVEAALCSVDVADGCSMRPIKKGRLSDDRLLCADRLFSPNKGLSPRITRESVASITMVAPPMNNATRHDRKSLSSITS